MRTPMAEVLARLIGAEAQAVIGAVTTSAAVQRIDAVVREAEDIPETQEATIIRTRRGQGAV